MGPITLFDKSFLQSLTEEEALWFDHFFLANVCPIFFVETQADLAKEEGRLTPEQLVERIAKKFPEISGAPNAYHPYISTSNLLGQDIPMTGCGVMLPAGCRVNSDSQSIIVYPESHEAKAFLRWTRQEIGEEERRLGELWRNSPYGTDPSVVIGHLKTIGVYEDTPCTTLKDVLPVTDRVMERCNPDHQMECVLQLLGILEDEKLKILERYVAAGRPRLETFAAYAAHALRVELFYHIAVDKGRLTPVHRMDTTYLNYLPFCAIVTSFDSVWAECARLFLRPDQEFVPGKELKAALTELNEKYLPDVETKSIMEVASKPPLDGNNLVTQLWDRHFTTWRTPKPRSEEETQKMTEWMREHGKEISRILQQGAKPSGSGIGFDAMVHTRHVRTRRGRWWTVPEAYRTKRPDR